MARPTCAAPRWEPHAESRNPTPRTGYGNAPRSPLHCNHLKTPLLFFFFFSLLSLPRRVAAEELHRRSGGGGGEARRAQSEGAIRSSPPRFGWARVADSAAAAVEVVVVDLGDGGS